MIITPKVSLRDFLPEIEYMRFVEFKTLKEIAGIFGVSHTRIYQLLGNTEQIEKQRQIRIQKYIEKSCNKTNDILSEELHLSKNTISKHRNKNYHAMTGNLGKGQRFEIIVAEKLIKYGFIVQIMPPMHSFDLLINNHIRVDVKSAYKPSNSPSRRKISKYNYWRFKLSHLSEDFCDIYVCIIKELNEIFIIPRVDLINSGFHTSHLIFPWPAGHKCKYEKYLNRFDLLNPVK